MTEEVRIEMTEEEIAFSDIIGDLVEQWGFKTHLGKVWSLLYLRNQPLNPTQIQETLQLSAGNVNALLSELQTWGVIKRIRVSGDRNFYYEPQTQIWKSISNVLRARELRILEEAISGLDTLKASLKKKDGDKGLRDFQMRRLAHVRDAIDSAALLTSLLLSASPERVAKIGKLVRRLQAL